jgi:hypothetical protein
MFRGPLYGFFSPGRFCHGRNLGPLNQVFKIVSNKNIVYNIKNQFNNENSGFYAFTQQELISNSWQLPIYQQAPK